jgi:UDP-glucose 4-epimerase
MSKSTVSLVTGGAGFIGSHVADYLLKLGHKVVVLDNLSGGFKKNIPQEAIFVKGSITNQKLLKKLFSTYKFDYVFHLAAYAAEGLSHFIRNFNYNNNLIGSINLINLSVIYHIKRFIYTSSIAVYGSNQAPFTEEIVPIPEDPYGIAKYAVELDLKAASAMFGLNYTIFRAHNVYGKRQNIFDPFRNVIGIFMKNILDNTSLPIFGDGQQKRAFSYIDDVAPYIANCINLKQTINKTYNIGSDSPYSVFDLANHVASAMSTTPKIKYLPIRHEVKYAFASHEKIKKDFNISSSVSLKNGLEKMAYWVKHSSNFERNPEPSRSSGSGSRVNLEVAINLPKSWEIYFKNSIKK